MDKIDKLYKKLGRISRQAKYEDFYDVTNADKVLPKLLETTKEIAVLVDAVLSELRHKTVATPYFMKRLGDAECAADNLRLFNQDPQKYVRDSNITYFDKKYVAYNIISHALTLSLAAFTSTRATNSIWRSKQ